MSFLKTLFPFIQAAAALGGPLGTMAANAVGSKLGIDKIDPTQAGIESAITAAVKDPEAMAKLQKAEQEFQLQMAALGFDSVEKLAQIDAEDRASARAREIAVRDRTPAILAYSTTFGYFGLLILVNFHAIPGESSVLMPPLLESLKIVWILQMGYYFGSSRGSQAKDATIAGMKGMQ